MKRQPPATIITLNFNGFSDTKICIEAVLKSTYKNFTYIVVDNGSDKNEAEELKKLFHDRRLRFVRFNKNWGFAEGNNKIMRIANSKYIVLLNNDTKVDPEWLTELVKIAESDENIAALQPKIRSLLNPDYFEYAGAAGGYLDKLGYPYARGRIGFFVEKDTCQYDQITDIFWASGTCILLRKKVLNSRELLTTDFFFYHEETDLCWRLNKDGFRIVFVPKAIVYHKGGATSKRNMPKRIFYVHRNNLFMIARNMPLSHLAVILPVRFFTDMLTIFYYLAKGYGALVFPVIWAEISFYAVLPKIIAKRAKTENHEKDTRIPLQPVSIFWEYYVLRKKKYTDIFKR